MDAHVHVLTNDTDVIKEKIKCNLETPNDCKQYPLSLFWNTGHSVFAATDPSILSRTFIYVATHGVACYILLHRTLQVHSS